MGKIKVAATQFSCCVEQQPNIDKAKELIKKAAEDGCNIVLIQELFGSTYFCQQERPERFDLAAPAHTKQNTLLAQMAEVAKEYKVVLPVSFFEKRNQIYYNSIMVFDADGKILGIPPGYSTIFSIK